MFDYTSLTNHLKTFIDTDVQTTKNWKVRRHLTNTLRELDIPYNYANMFAVAFDIEVEQSDYDDSQLEEIGSLLAQLVYKVYKSFDSLDLVTDETIGLMCKDLSFKV